NLAGSPAALSKSAGCAAGCRSHATDSETRLLKSACRECPARDRVVYPSDLPRLSRDTPASPRLSRREIFGWIPTTRDVPSGASGGIRKRKIPAAGNRRGTWGSVGTNGLLLLTERAIPFVR